MTPNRVATDDPHHPLRCAPGAGDGVSTGIQWTDETWNPVTGCSKVSPGCAHCYAETLALTRLAGKPGYPGLPWTPENAAANVVLRPDRLTIPLPGSVGTWDMVREARRRNIPVYVVGLTA